MKNNTVVHPTWGEGVHSYRMTELKSDWMYNARPHTISNAIDWRDSFADLPMYVHWASSSPYLSGAYQLISIDNNEGGTVDTPQRKRV